MNREKITVGIDIGGTNTVIGFISEAGKYKNGNSLATQSNESAEKFVVRLTEKIKESTENYELSGIGIAAPSVNAAHGTIESPSNLNWGDVDIVSLVKTYFNIPVYVINDANAAALGEYHFGKGRGMKNFIVITLGTGLGSGIIADGNLIFGEGGLAGELGHTIVKENGRICNCGRRGCLETYTSAKGICRTVFHLLSNDNSPSELRNITYNNLNGEMVCDFARKGDPIALKAYAYTGEILGKAIANIVACFSPEAVILFGGLADSGDLLLEPTKLFLEENLLHVYKGKVKILKSDLQNGKAAVMGACSFVNESIYRNSLQII